MITDDVNLKGYDKPFTLKQFAQYAMCAENDSEEYVYLRTQVTNWYRYTVVSFDRALTQFENCPEFMNAYRSQSSARSLNKFIIRIWREMVSLAEKRYGRDWLRDDNNSLE